MRYVMLLLIVVWCGCAAPVLAQKPTTGPPGTAIPDPRLRPTPAHVYLPVLGGPDDH